MSLSRLAVSLPVASLVAVVVLAGVAGCKDSRRLPTQQWKAEVGALTVDGVTLDRNAAPRQVVDALFKQIRSSLDVRRHGLGDPQRAATFAELQTTIRRLAAPSAILEKARIAGKHLMPADLTAEKAVQIIADSWPAIVAHYIEGLDPASAMEMPVEENAVRVVIPAERPSDRETRAELQAKLADQRDERGDPLRPGTPAYEDRLKHALLERGISPNPRALIGVELAKEAGYWRVVSVYVGADTATTLGAITPTTQPTTRPTSPA